MIGQIIDWEVRGSCVKFYIGQYTEEKGWLNDEGYEYYSKANLTPEEFNKIKNEYTGDDWNDKPYEHNAGQVYKEYVKGIRYNYYPFDAVILQPIDESSIPKLFTDIPEYSKDDFKNKKVPIIIYVKDKEFYEQHREWTYKEWSKAKNSVVEKFYLGDTLQTGSMLSLGKEGILIHSKGE